MIMMDCMIAVARKDFSVETAQTLIDSTLAGETRFVTKKIIPNFVDERKQVHEDL